MGLFSLSATMVKQYCYHGRVSAARPDINHVPAPTANIHMVETGAGTRTQRTGARSHAREPARDRPAYN